MSGALIIITIPTENEEKQLQQNKTKKLRFNIPQISKNHKLLVNNDNIDDINLQKRLNNIPLSFGDLQYGTFTKTDKSVSPLSKLFSGKNSQTVTINDQFISPIKNSENNKEEIFSPNESLKISSSSSMEVILKDIFKKLKIDHTTWNKSNNEKFYQIIFSIEYDEKYETLLRKLNEWGIGDREGSTVSILHCTTFNTFAKDVNVDETYDNEEIIIQKQTAWNRFMNSFTSRLNVAQIVRDIRQEASITFDFIILLISAAILASFGLVGDSTIFLASSMLVSPLMGPIIATIFGTAIKDRSLQSLGIINELIGVISAILVGYTFGIIMCAIDEKYETGDGFTAEILSRCELDSLFIGCLIAIPSGAAAAIAVLGGNVGSLVGVAISASILPPAVNSGIVWAFATICMMYQSDEKRFNFAVKKKLYSHDQTSELIIRGGISMCITISNIICIYIMGILVLKVKEIAPAISRNNRQFWKHDIKIARDLSKNCSGGDSDVISGITINENKNTLIFDPKVINSLNIGNALYQNTWSPMGNRHSLELLSNRHNHSNLRELEKLYMTVTKPNNYENGKYSRGNVGLTLYDLPKSRPSIYNMSSKLSSRHAQTLDIVQGNRQQFRNRVGNNFKWEPLEKLRNESISNLNKENCGESEKFKISLNNEKRSIRKFTITPALDDDILSLSSTATTVLEKK